MNFKVFINSVESKNLVKLELSKIYIDKDAMTKYVFFRIEGEVLFYGTVKYDENIKLSCIDYVQVLD